MKNLKFIPLLVLIIMSQSCTTESIPTNPDPVSEVSSTENKTTELINYTYKDQKFAIQYEKEKNGDELVPIEDEAYELLNKITDQNKTLITYVVDKNNYILFNAEVDLNNFLRVSHINKNSYVSKTTVSSPYDDPNSLRIFGNSNLYIPTEIKWNGPTGVHGGTAGCYFINSTNESRLKNFSNTPFWIVYTNGPYNCNFNNEFIGNNPNDKVSSISVSGCYARAYEDANYGGRSFVLDARNGATLQIYNLKDLRRASWGRNWNDNISSIQLSY